MLDSSTLIVALMTSHALSTLIIFVNWRFAPNVPGVKDWVIGRLIVAIALVAFAARGQIPLLTSVLAGNGLTFWGSIIVLQGTRRFLGAPERRLWPYALGVAAFLVAMTHYTVTDDSLLARATLSSIFLGLYSAAYVAIIARHNTAQYLTVRIFALVIGLHGLFHIIMGCSYTYLLRHNDLLEPSTAFSAYFFEGLMISILSACLYIAMTAEYLNRDLKEQANFDPLTRAINRRAFIPLAEHTLERRKREYSPISLLMLDLDNFKQVNDTYGHTTGDEVLRQASAVLHQTLRAQDVLCRYGGEEFIVLCPNTQSGDAAIVAERIRHAVETLRITVDDAVINPTISIGYATYPSNSDHHDLTLLINTADSALYEAKSNGRNCVKRGYPEA